MQDSCQSTGVAGCGLQRVEGSLGVERERGSEGARERGSEGARERGSEGARAVRGGEEY